MVKNHIKTIDGIFGYRKKNHPVAILEHIDLEVNEGDFIGLVGLNGSGKSTLLRSLCGLMPVLGGKVLLEGKLISDMPNNELAKTISIVLTERISGFNLTAFDAVSAGQMPYTNLFNKLEKSNLDIIDEAIQRCGIADQRHKFLAELSDGLFQKTMIAKSIAQQTKIMLLDEPSAFLDYASKHQLFLLLKSLAGQKQKSVIVSSHDLDLILRYCNKVMLIKDGSIHEMNIEEAKKFPAFLELSGGYL